MDAGRRRSIRAPAPAPAAVIDTRRYQRMIGLIGLVLVVALSVYLFVNHRTSSTTGVTAGHRLRWFAAPLATSDLRGAANLHPPCRLAEHDPRALNLCIDASRGPIVLSLFVLGGGRVSVRSTRCRRSRGGSPVPRCSSSRSH